MLEKIFTRPVELIIDNKTITFNSIDDFEFAVNARTTIPLKKINEAIKADPGELKLELNSIDIAMEQLSELKQKSPAASEITQGLKSINPVVFSNDNGWRDIFFALKNDRSPESSQYKQIALSAYLKYLLNRKQMIQMIQSQLKKETGETPQFKTGALDCDDDFDSKQLGKKLGMTCMRKDKPVLITLKEKDEVALLLADYQCKLVFEQEGIQFIDHHNIKYLIEKGTNRVGRSRECNIRFADSTHRISRLHLEIIHQNNRQVKLIDHSTYGTHYHQHSA